MDLDVSLAAKLVHKKLAEQLYICIYNVIIMLLILLESWVGDFEREE